MDSGKKYGWIVSLRAFAAMAIVLAVNSIEGDCLRYKVVLC